MYWERHPQRSDRFPKGGDSAPRGLRDCIRSPYTSERRDLLGNTSLEDREISQVRYIVEEIIAGPLFLLAFFSMQREFCEKKVLEPTLLRIGRWAAGVFLFSSVL